MIQKKIFGAMLVIGLLLAIIIYGSYQPATIYDVKTSKEVLFVPHDGQNLYVSTIDASVSCLEPATGFFDPGTDLQIKVTIDPSNEGLTPVANDAYFQIMKYDLTLYINGEVGEIFARTPLDTKYSTGVATIIIESTDIEFDLSDFTIVEGDIIKVSVKATFHSVHQEYIDGTPIPILYAYDTPHHEITYLTFTIPNLDDTDGDGLPDNWERSYWGNLYQTATADPDGDSRNNLLEYQEGTNPTIKDDTTSYASVWAVGARDSVSLAPISGATVTLGDKTGVTDSTGYYTFTDISAGTYVATIAADGYVTITKSKTFTGEGETSSLYSLVAGVDPDPDPDPTPGTFDWNLYVYGSIIAAFAVIAISLGAIPGAFRIGRFVGVVIAGVLFILAYMFGTGVI